MKLLAIMARYGTDDYPGVENRILAHLEKRLPGTDVDLLVVDSSMPPGTKAADGGIDVIGAENADYEFGAWMEGLSAVESRSLGYDYLLLLTAACFNAYTDYLEYLDDDLLAHYRRRPVAFGHFEVYDEPVSFEGVKFQFWIRSSFILMPMVEARLLGGVMAVGSEYTIFGDDPSKPFLSPSVLSDNYISYITSWLTSDRGTGQGTQWHSRFALSEETLPKFKQKSRMIINEMMLSRTLEAGGCRLVDMTWLNARRAGGEGAFPPIPDWHEQVVSRGTGHEGIVRG